MAQLGVELTDHFTRMEAKEMSLSRVHAESNQKIGQLTSKHKVLRREAALVLAQARLS